LNNLPYGQALTKPVEPSVNIVQWQPMRQQAVDGKTAAPE
jgi:hypothetical protein